MKTTEKVETHRLRKIYQPVTDFERQTSHCPLYLAWRILDEARGYFCTTLPQTYADKLAGRAEAVFARNPFWQRKFKCQHGRDAILVSMRHWLAGVLARDQPALFRELPESFMLGEPLPLQPLFRPKKARRDGPAARPCKPFAHGRELPAV
ncbi:MAG TPA: hypothetical protein VFC44_26445 [Candidatus Saccharimonadales bacterium]|nr:hypothetical protein [Candidatus Saccharimonadales bacterium]